MSSLTFSNAIQWAEFLAGSFWPPGLLFDTSVLEAMNTWYKSALEISNYLILCKSWQFLLTLT